MKSGWSLKLHPFYFVILETMERYGVPTIFAIFGVTGDLAQKKIFPALMDLYIKDLLPKKFAIIGVARFVTAIRTGSGTAVRSNFVHRPVAYQTVV